MDLASYLKDRGQLVNEALERLLPSEDDFPESLHKAMRYSLFAGGKRLRPILAIAAAEAVGGAAADTLDAACALECIHTYSLIHDDLPAMDDDDLRRGRPTCHKAFDEGTAILAGDGLLTLSFEIMAGLSEGGVSKDKVIDVLLAVAHASGTLGMIGGQVVDMESEGTDITLPMLEHIHIHKTGALILASVKTGAILAGANSGELLALTGYGKAVGLAFQIADDILDVEGTTEELGKSAGADELHGKATYPALMGLKESKERALDLAEKAKAHLDCFGDEADALRAIASYAVGRKN